MSKRTFIVFNPSGGHEYDITIESSEKGEIYSLFRSNSSDWSEKFRGDLILQMIDSGNNVRFDRQFQTFEYDEIFEFQLLVNLKTTLENEDKFKVVEGKFLFEL